MEMGTLRMMLHVSKQDEKAKVVLQGKDDEQKGRWQQLIWQHLHTQDWHPQQRWTWQMATHHFAWERTSECCWKRLLVSCLNPRLSLLKNEESVKSSYSAFTKLYTTKMMFGNNRVLTGDYFYFLSSKLIQGHLPATLPQDNYSIKSVFIRKKKLQIYGRTQDYKLFIKIHH